MSGLLNAQNRANLAGGKSAERWQPIVAQIAQNAATYPDRIAVVDIANNALSYGELNAQANRLAHKILSRRGDAEEGIAFLSGLETASVISLLGIWKTGKFYVALDPSSPPERLQSIVQDIQARLIITNSANLELASQVSENEIEIINLDNLEDDLAKEDPEIEISPDALAAVFYTSGSTGAPKGAMTSHRAQAYSVAKAIKTGGYTSDDRVLQPFGFSFAWSSSRTHRALVPGGTLYLCDYNSMAVEDIANWLLENQITSLVMTSSLFSQFAAALPENLPTKFPHVRELNIGGESFNPRLLHSWKKYFSPHSFISTSFASTEAGVLTRRIYTFDSVIDENEMRFGVPEPEVKIFILDDQGLVLPTGETGRVAVSSPTVTQGYWRRPDLNEEMFIPHPEDPDSTILLTKDLGRLNKDGSLEFRGRWDAMLKIRGFRVEPGEIESALHKHPSIQNAAVTGQRPLNAPEEIALVAYIVPKSAKALDASSLRGFLAKQLPHYMVPSYYLFMNALPLTRNGKVDRNKLPQPDWASTPSTN